MNLEPRYTKQNQNKMGVGEGSLDFLTILWGEGRRFLIQKFMLHYSSDLSLKTFLCARRVLGGRGLKKPAPGRARARGGISGVLRRVGRGYPRP